LDSPIRADDVVEGFRAALEAPAQIACGHASFAAAIMLDEPTVGVDPQRASEFSPWSKQRRRAAPRFLYSTHYWKKRNASATGFILIDHGNIVAPAPPPE